MGHSIHFWTGAGAAGKGAPASAAAVPAASAAPVSFLQQPPVWLQSQLVRHLLLKACCPAWLQLPLPLPLPPACFCAATLPSFSVCCGGCLLFFLQPPTAAFDCNCHNHGARAELASAAISSVDDSPQDSTASHAGQQNMISGTASGHQIVAGVVLTSNRARMAASALSAVRCGNSVAISAYVCHLSAAAAPQLPRLQARARRSRYS